MNLILQRMLNIYLGSPQGRSDIGIAVSGLASFHGYEQGSPSDTRDYVNEFIPTFEEIDQMKDTYIVHQGAQEIAAHVYQFALPWPIKVGLEVYSFYDYFKD